MSLGRNIRKYRRKVGISQDRLSKQANVTLHAIAKIESEATLDPRIETVKRIAEALGCSIDELTAE